MRSCERCGVDFVPLSNTAGRFCSLRCWHETPRNRLMITCMGCGASVHGKKTRKFCSRKCASHSFTAPRWISEAQPPSGAAWLPLPQGQSALVDKTDLQALSKHLWRFNAARRNVAGTVQGKTVLLHRFLLNAPDGLLVDHINGDPLDNRRSNLRLATDEQNAWNSRKKRGTSRFKGVSLVRPTGRWSSMIRVDGATRFLGNYLTEEDAARAYDAVARERFGEFACVNFPIGNERGAAR